VKGVGPKLLAGTDTSGLVLEIDPAAKTGRVILDAAEKEITALIADGHGGVYVATGDVSKAGKTAKTGTKNGKADKKSKAKAKTKTKTSPAKGKSKTPAKGKSSEPEQAPDKENQKEGTKSKKVITVTIPEGKKLPTVTKDGKKHYLLPGKKGGKAVAVPVENVRVKYKNSGKKSPKKFAKIPPKLLQMMKKKAAAMKSTAKVSGKGNAVYHINAAGMVRTIFRRPVVIQAMVLRADELILATGNEGKILFVSTDGMLCGELVDTDAKQVTALVSADGVLVFATSNKGSVGRIGKTYAAKGTLVSKPMDAKQIAQWGTLKLIGKAPEGTKLTVATRSGNIAKAEDNTWSSWSKEMPITDGFVSIGSPAARFLQYRLTLTSGGKATPLLGSIQAIYQMGNLPPAIDGIKVTASNKGDKAAAMTKAFRHIAIKAHDPNKDKLKFTVQYRPVNTKPWVKITDDLKKPMYAWDTRTTDDGIYEIRLTASDSPSNPSTAALEGSRISEPVVVDNTPPTCKELGVNMTDKQKAKVRGLIVDSMSRIVHMSYSVDSATEWKTFLPADGICDSSEEKFRFEIDDLKAGAHRLTFRFVDIYGNTCYTGVNVTVGK
ncbi:MAG: hypothetical protein K8S14_00015, partial [Actinomycetia bacterium]|nr:hypothetical protein [Actinomycetes bacterium]